MCQECGCGETEIILDKSVNEENNKIAHELWHELKDKGILVINVEGAPGCGKTSFIEAMGKFLDNICVIQGDLESNIDKLRLEKLEIPTYQINTHSGCHLNAQMIKDSLNNLDVEHKKYLFIENVGNLVCPAGVKIGQHINIVLSAVSEGGDKPKKYPIIFKDAKAVLITKFDLSPYVDFNEKQYMGDLSEINKEVNIFKVSTKEQETFSTVANFLKKEREQLMREKHDH